VNTAVIYNVETHSSYVKLTLRYDTSY